MKEILYLDTDNMNSLLAQLDQGIINDYTLEETTQTSQGTTAQSALGTEFGTKAGLSLDTGFLPGGGLNFSVNAGGNESESEISSYKIIEGQRDLLNKKFHDYALNILLNKLNDNNMIVKENYGEGDLIKITGKFDFYDFSLIRIASDPLLWKELISWEEFGRETTITVQEAKKVYEKVMAGKQLTKKEQENKDEALTTHLKNVEIQNIVDVMSKLAVHSSTTDKLFKDLTFIKSSNLVGLLKKQFLRESTESLSFRGSNTREATFIGRVIGIKEVVIDGTNLQDFSPSEINKIPNILLDILLGSFDILEVGDTLISPIAIYYESN